ncbi:hypothetical protein [Pedobacter frigiditerrae]|uniref:hypothetical protein n=1 Tax=Pedobacter frigiditerrae TaxID=2530452 RepID=UPI001981F6BA|nr:hypothetical protein [Pedobacter frigiditerrae]
MKPIDFLKLQAKNLHKDYKTQTSYFDKVARRNSYRYSPKYFDVKGIIIDFNIPEDNFSLMNAQHVISKFAGFNKWADMAKASPVELELAKLLFENAHKVSVEEWKDYIAHGEKENNTRFDAETKLEIFTNVWVPAEGIESLHYDYRISTGKLKITEKKHPRSYETKESEQITSLPLSAENRKEFIDTARNAFERIIESIEPEHPEQTRELWNPEHYIDKILLREDMLPISKDYALSLIDAFLVGHVIQLASEADDNAMSID